MEYAHLFNARADRVNARTIHSALAAQFDVIDSVTLATHTEPWVVFVRTTRALSDDEKQTLSTALGAI